MPLDARDIMTRAVVAVRPGDTVAQVAKVLTEHDISAVPVTEADGTLVGMISEGDLMRPFGAKNALRRAWWLNVLAEGTELAPEFAAYVRADHHPARELMTKQVVSVTEGTSAAEIADLLAQHHVKRVPVVREGKVVGIVSRADLIHALAERPEAFQEPL